MLQMFLFQEFNFTLHYVYSVSSGTIGSKPQPSLELTFYNLQLAHTCIIGLVLEYTANILLKSK